MIADYQQKGIYYEEENFSSCIRLDIVLRNDRMCVIGQSGNRYIYYNCFVESIADID